jgi:hypothetical protein
MVQHYPHPSQKKNVWLSGSVGLVPFQFQVSSTRFVFFLNYPKLPTSQNLKNILRDHIYPNIYCIQLIPIVSNFEKKKDNKSIQIHPNISKHFKEEMEHTDLTL